MGNRYAGTAHQHSALADRADSPRNPRGTSSIATKATTLDCAPRTVHRGRRDGTRNVQTL